MGPLQCFIRTNRSPTDYANERRILGGSRPGTQISVLPPSFCVSEQAPSPLRRHWRHAAPPPRQGPPSPLSPCRRQSLWPAVRATARAAAVQPAGSVPVWLRPDPWPWGLDPLPLWPDLWSALLGGAAVAAGPTARRCDDGGSFGSTASSSSSSVVQAEVDVDGSACSAAGSVRRWLDLVAAAELASLQYFRRLDSARVAGGRVQSWLPRPSLRRIRWCSGWIWRRRGGWPSAASGRALV